MSPKHRRALIFYSLSHPITTATYGPTVPKRAYSEGVSTSSGTVAGTGLASRVDLDESLELLLRDAQLVGGRMPPPQHLHDL